MQTTARRNEWPLDKTVIVTDVTKRQPEQLEAPSKEGAFIHGWAPPLGEIPQSRAAHLSTHPINELSAIDLKQPSDS